MLTVIVQGNPSALRHYASVEHVDEGCPVETNRYIVLSVAIDNVNQSVFVHIQERCGYIADTL